MRRRRASDARTRSSSGPSFVATVMSLTSAAGRRRVRCISFLMPPTRGSEGQIRGGTGMSIFDFGGCRVLKVDSVDVDFEDVHHARRAVLTPRRDAWWTWWM